jgi:hypothetical protein
MAKERHESLSTIPIGEREVTNVCSLIMISSNHCRDNHKICISVRKSANSKGVICSH